MYLDARLSTYLLGREERKRRKEGKEERRKEGEKKLDTPEFRIK